MERDNNMFLSRNNENTYYEIRKNIFLNKNDMIRQLDPKFFEVYKTIMEMDSNFFKVYDMIIHGFDNSNHFSHDAEVQPVENIDGRKI